MNEFADRYNFGPVHKYSFWFEKGDFPLQFDLASKRTRFCLKREICPSALVIRPHASLFVSKGDFSLRIDLSSTRIRFCFKREIFPFGLVFHPYVSVFV